MRKGKMKKEKKKKRMNKKDEIMNNKYKRYTHMIIF